jgi:putative transposase
MKRINMEKMWQDTLINNPEFLQQTMRNLLQTCIKEEFREFIGADVYQRSDARRGLRNGSYERTLKTRVGAITLHVCRDRDGEFKTELFDRYQRSEKALVLTIIDMYLEGVSTRKIGSIVEELCGFSVSKSQVSELTKKLDTDVHAWRMRPLVTTYLYLLFDARYEKIRENDRVVSKAFVTAIGITIDGKREIIGCWVINSESFEAWDHCFEELIQRGLSDIKFVASDENLGLKHAIKKRFQGAQWQRCQVHFMRNFIGKLAKSQQAEGIKLLQDLFNAPSKEAALERLNPLREFLCRQKKESVAQWIEDNIEDTLAVFSLPEEHRRKMRSTNMVERLNEELKRRSKVVRIFPNEQSCLRLLSALCQDFSEAWDERRYLDM